jgi:hypothetical protein
MRAADERTAHGLQLEPQSRPCSMTEPNGPELVGVRIDPASIDTEDCRDGRGVDEPLSPRGLDRGQHQLCRAPCDRLDVGGMQSRRLGHRGSATGLQRATSRRRRQHERRLSHHVVAIAPVGIELARGTRAPLPLPRVERARQTPLKAHTELSTRTAPRPETRHLRAHFTRSPRLASRAHHPYADLARAAFDADAVRFADPAAFDLRFR